jgi:hypothetical protein
MGGLTAWEREVMLEGETLRATCYSKDPLEVIFTVQPLLCWSAALVGCSLIIESTRRSARDYAYQGPRSAPTGITLPIVNEMPMLDAIHAGWADR